MSWELLEPRHLWAAALPLALAVFFLLRRRSPRRRFLVPFFGPLDIMRRQTRKLRWIHRFFFATTLVCLCGFAWAAARPVLRETWTERHTDGIDIMITLDVSESMNADDFYPMRIRVAKNVISDFIRRRKYDRIGLNIFAGESVTKSPLTRDHRFLLSQVQAVQLRELRMGTAIGMGLTNAILRLKNSPAKGKIIVLLTDGDSNVGSINPMTAARLARQEGIKIYTIGMGQKNRVVVTVNQYDEDGNKIGPPTKIPSYLNPALLRDIAQTTGGKAYMARDSGTLNRVLREIDTLEKTKVKMLPRQKEHEQYFWPALVFTLLLYLIYVAQETRWRRGGRRYVPAV